MVKVWRWLADEPHQTVGVRALQVALGSMLLYRVFTEAPFAAYFWGPNGLGSGSSQVILGPSIGGVVDTIFSTESGTVGLIGVLGAGALGLILGCWTRASTALALIAFFLLEQRLPHLTDGGDNVTRLVLTYMLFALPARASPAPGSLSVWLHNVAVLAIALQVVVLYATSGFMKASGDKWHHGVALYYISQVEWFSLPSFREIFKNPLITTAATYVPMLYLLMFPVAIVSRLKLPWLLVGILFHLGIAIFMGLVTFSAAMIGLALFLVSDSEYGWMKARVSMMEARLHRVATRPRWRLPGTLSALRERILETQRRTL